MGAYSHLSLTANAQRNAIQVPCGDVISFVCQASGQFGDRIVLYKGGSNGRALINSRIPNDIHYKIADASSSDTSWYTCTDETRYALDDRVYVSVTSCLDTDVPNPIILWSCLAVVVLVIAILASLISYFRMMKRSSGRSTRREDQRPATGTTNTTITHNRTSENFNLSLPTVSSGDVRQSRWGAVSSRMADTPPYRSLRDFDVDPPSYGSVVPDDDFTAVAADVTSSAHAPPPYSSVIADPPAYPGCNY